MMTMFMMTLVMIMINDDDDDDIDDDDDNVYNSSYLKFLFDYSFRYVSIKLLQDIQYFSFIQSSFTTIISQDKLFF